MIDASRTHAAGPHVQRYQAPSNNHEYLKKRHGLFDDLVKNISGFAALIEKALE
ncbi:MAG TPA: hypothetical protein VMN77_09610 [Nitrospiria bacterium]|jgi:hypothetical protein|nr:hypothetical protein [Nitrospiria bacterium]